MEIIIDAYTKEFIWKKWDPDNNQQTVIWESKFLKARQITLAIRYSAILPAQNRNVD